MSNRAQAIAERKAFVLANYKKMTARAIAEKFGVSRSNIDVMCIKLGLKTPVPPATPWTQEHLKKLVLLYPTTGNKVLVALFERSEKSILAKANEFGLRKSDEFRATRGRKPAPPALPDQKNTAAFSVTGPERVAAAQKLRITYTPETLPYKARAMAQAWTPPDLTYRGQASAPHIDLRSSKPRKTKEKTA